MVVWNCAWSFVGRALFCFDQSGLACKSVQQYILHLFVVINIYINQELPYRTQTSGQNEAIDGELTP